MLRSSCILAVLFLLGFSIGSSAAEISVLDPYARAVPLGQPNSAVFMSLASRAAVDHALVGAQSPVAEVVELHTHLQEDGMMRMRRIERIDLPAGKTVVLQPGGLHVMLIGLKRALAPGDSVELTLLYDDGEQVTLEVPVRRIEMHQMNHP